MNSSLRPFELDSPALFHRELRKIPPLSREEEVELARKWRDDSDFAAIQRLIMSNLHSVAAIAREYRHFNLPYMDLVQEGTLGLMHAAKRFDPERGFRLKTYAAYWIRATIHDYILRNWSIVKIGTNKLQRKIFAGLQKARHAIAALEGKDAEDIGAEYGVSGEKFQEIAAAFLQRDASLDAEGEDGMTPVVALPAPDPTPEEIAIEEDWQAHRKLVLAEAMGKLTERDRHIIEMRHVQEPPATLKDLAEEFGVSIERVRQLEKRAMKRMKESIELSQQRALPAPGDSIKALPYE